MNLLNLPMIRHCIFLGGLLVLKYSNVINKNIWLYSGTGIYRKILNIMELINSF
jgi:hypothetical protein